VRRGYRVVIEDFESDPKQYAFTDNYTRISVALVVDDCKYQLNRMVSNEVADSHILPELIREMKHNIEEQISGTTKEAQ
jgi:hypothetical protein